MIVKAKLHLASSVTTVEVRGREEVEVVHLTLVDGVEGLSAFFLFFFFVVVVVVGIQCLIFIVKNVSALLGCLSPGPKRGKSFLFC